MFDTLRDNSRIIVYIVVIVFVISGGFMGFGAYLNSRGGGQSSNQRSSVIAEVNGMEISQQEYLNLLQQQAPQSNLNSSQITPFRYNILNALIERKLILSQSEELGVEVEVSDSEVDENYNNILEQNDMTDEELANNLAEQGYTIGELREDIRANLKTNKKITETIDQGIGEISVSDQEIKESYEEKYASDSEQSSAENSDSESKPALSEVEEDLRTELKNQKRNQARNKWLNDLKDLADITINNPVLSAYHDLENENYDQAAEKFSSLVEQEQSDPIFYSYLAQAYEGQNNYDKAEEVYQNSVNDYPENTNLRFNYAKFLMDRENTEKAVSQLDTIEAGDNFMNHYQLYMLYSQLGAEEKAQKAMQEIQRLSEQRQNNAQSQTGDGISEEVTPDSSEVPSEEEIQEDISNEESSSENGSGNESTQENN